MKRKMQLAKLPDNWNSEQEMGSRQGNTIEPFLRFSVPEKKNILRGEQKKRRSVVHQRRKRLTTSWDSCTVNCLAADSGWPSSSTAGVTFLIRFLAGLVSAINASLACHHPPLLKKYLCRAVEHRLIIERSGQGQNIWQVFADLRNLVVHRRKNKSSKITEEKENKKWKKSRRSGVHDIG